MDKLYLEQISNSPYIDEGVWDKAKSKIGNINKFADNSPVPQSQETIPSDMIAIDVAGYINWVDPVNGQYYEYSIIGDGPLGNAPTTLPQSVINTINKTTNLKLAYDKAAAHKLNKSTLTISSDGTISYIDPFTNNLRSYNLRDTQKEVPRYIHAALNTNPMLKTEYDKFTIKQPRITNFYSIILRTIKIIITTVAKDKTRSLPYFDMSKPLPTNWTDIAGKYEAGGEYRIGVSEDVTPNTTEKPPIDRSKDIKKNADTSDDEKDTKPHFIPDKFLYNFHSAYNKMREFTLEMDGSPTLNKIDERTRLEVVWHNKTHENNIYIKYGSPTPKVVIGKAATRIEKSKKEDVLAEGYSSFLLFKFWDDQVMPESKTANQFDVYKLMQEAHPTIDKILKQIVPNPNTLKQIDELSKGPNSKLFRALYSVIDRKRMEFKSEKILLYLNEKGWVMRYSRTGPVHVPDEKIKTYLKTEKEKWFQPLVDIKYFDKHPEMLPLDQIPELNAAVSKLSSDQFFIDSVIKFLNPQNKNEKVTKEQAINQIEEWAHDVVLLYGTNHTTSEFSKFITDSMMKGAKLNKSVPPVGYSQPKIPDEISSLIDTDITGFNVTKEDEQKLKAFLKKVVTEYPDLLPVYDKFFVWSLQTKLKNRKNLADKIILTVESLLGAYKGLTSAAIDNRSAMEGLKAAFDNYGINHDHNFYANAAMIYIKGYPFPDDPMNFAYPKKTPSDIIPSKPEQVLNKSKFVFSKDGKTITYKNAEGDNVNIDVQKINPSSDIFKQIKKDPTAFKQYKQTIKKFKSENPERLKENLINPYQMENFL